MTMTPSLALSGPQEKPFLMTAGILLSFLPLPRAKHPRTPKACKNLATHKTTVTISV